MTQIVLNLISLLAAAAALAIALYGLRAVYRSIDIAHRTIRELRQELCAREPVLASALLRAVTGLLLRRKVRMMESIVLISGISAVLQAIQTWLQFRDSRRAAQRFDERYITALEAADVATEAERVASIVPSDVLEMMVQRARRCWERYKEVLEDGLPGEIDHATQRVQRCICQELQRIYDLNGGLPPGELQQWWDQYCARMKS